MPRALKPCVLLVLLTVLMAGCDLPFGNKGQTEVAVIPASMLKPPYLQISDTVQAGEPFLVTVTTAGPDGCYSAASTDVRAAAGIISVTPYHRVVDALCTQAPVQLKRTVELPPRPAGTTAVHVIARPRHDDGDVSVLAVKYVIVR